MARNAQDMGFLDFFSDIPDPRMGGKVVYPMPELLFLSLCAMISGSERNRDRKETDERNRDSHSLRYSAYTTSANA